MLVNFILYPSFINIIFESHEELFINNIHTYVCRPKYFPVSSNLSILWKPLPHCLSKAVSEIRFHTLISYLLKFPFLLSLLPYWIILPYVQDSKGPIYFFFSEYEFSILIIYSLNLPSISFHFVSPGVTPLGSCLLHVFVVLQS